MAMTPQERTEFEALKNLVQSLLRVENVPFIENIKRRIVDPKIAVALGALTLDDITDVTLTSPTNGQVLEYDNGQWINATDNV